MVRANAREPDTTLEKRFADLERQIAAQKTEITTLREQVVASGQPDTAREGVVPMVSAATIKEFFETEDPATVYFTANHNQMLMLRDEKRTMDPATQEMIVTPTMSAKFQQWAGPGSELRVAKSGEPAGSARFPKGIGRLDLAILFPAEPTDGIEQLRAKIASMRALQVGDQIVYTSAEFKRMLQPIYRKEAAAREIDAEFNANEAKIQASGQGDTKAM